MILQFRTETNKNGNCLYLAIDTGAECYATNPIGWISKEFPVLKLKDYRAILDQLNRNKFEQIERM